MTWIYLLIAGIFEMVWAVGLKYCSGFKLNWPLVIVIGAMACSMFFLSLAMKQIPIGTAYAVWTGIGILGVATYGIIVFNEPASLSRILFLSMILLGIIGLKICDKS